MRVLIAQETGKSAFDPSVVLEAKRRVARQLNANEPKAALTGEAPRGNGQPPPVSEDPLPIVLAAIHTIYDDGRFGDRKIFIAALWDRVGGTIGRALPEFKHWLIEQHFRKRLVLARADLIAAMPYELVERSEAKIVGNYAPTFHFVVDPSI